MQNKQEKRFVYKGGEGIWQEWLDTKTGKSTIETHDPKRISTFDQCDHFYEMVDDQNAQCRICHHGQRIVWGLMFLKNGKVEPFSSSKV